MSRTKGLNSVIRHPHDEYITPPWCVKRLLEKYELPRSGLLFDPCASRGELLSTVHTLRPDLLLYGVEINPNCHSALVSAAGAFERAWIGDFLKMQSPEIPSATTILTNPPYSLAEQFILQALLFAKRVIMLLRVNFLAGKDRREFTARTNPGVFVLPNRPSFNGWGSDGTEYGWFVYGDPAVAGRWQVLDLTPIEEIAEWNGKMRIRYPKPVEAAA